MTVFQLLAEYYPEVIFKLRKHFPKMLEFSKNVPVMPWKEEYNVVDFNPEVIESLKILENLLREGVISEEEYKERRLKLLEDTRYSSRTEGVAFIEEGFVSFRDEKPSLSTILHELGHVYFREPDLFWNRRYGGGEELFYLALNEKYEIREEHVYRYMDYLKRAHREPETLGKELTEKIQGKLKLDCVSHLYVFMIHAGTIPFDIKPENYFPDLNDRRWLSVPYSREGVLNFLVNVVDGLKYNDSFYVIFAEAIGIIENLNL